MLVVPIGGGGLIERHGHRGQGAQARHRADRRRGRALSVDVNARSRAADLPLGGDTLAEGIAVKEPGELTARILEELVDDIVLVAERATRAGGGAAAADREDRGRGRGRRRARGGARTTRSASRARRSALVLCGGNIDTRLLANVLLRDLVRQGRIARLRIAAAGPPRRAVSIMREFDERRSTSSRSTTSASSPRCRPRA